MESTDISDDSEILNDEGSAANSNSGNDAELRRARGEARENRLRRQQAEKAAQNAMAKAEALEAQMNSFRDVYEKRIIQATLREKAKEAGIVDVDILKLVDLSDAKLNEQGEYEGADEKLSKLREAKSWAFRETVRTTTDTSPAPKPSQPKAKDATRMTAEEFEAGLAELRRLS